MLAVLYIAFYAFHIYLTPSKNQLVKYNQQRGQGLQWKGNIIIVVLKTVVPLHK